MYPRHGRIMVHGSLRVKCQGQYRHEIVTHVRWTRTPASLAGCWASWRNELSLKSICVERGQTVSTRRTPRQCFNLNPGHLKFDAMARLSLEELTVSCLRLPRRSLNMRRSMQHESLKNRTAARCDKDRPWMALDPSILVIQDIPRLLEKNTAWRVKFFA